MCGVDWAQCCCDEEDLERDCQCCKCCATLCDCSEIGNCCNPDGCCYCRCPSFNCFNYSCAIAFVRAVYLFLHTLLIGVSIFGLIWSNVYFKDFDRTFLGSFIGGHLATLSAGGLLVGLSGMYAAIKRHRRLLYSHALVGWAAVLLRGYTWLLAMLHDYPLDLGVYAIAPIELALASLASLLLRDALKYF